MEETRKPSVIVFRVSERDLARIKKVATLRFLQKHNGMNKPTISDYLRMLVQRDLQETIQEIRARRKV